jgi:hypothetical protein
MIFDCSSNYYEPQSYHLLHFFRWISFLEKTFLSPYPSILVYSIHVLEILLSSYDIYHIYQLNLMTKESILLLTQDSTYTIQHNTVQ